MMDFYLCQYAMIGLEKEIQQLYEPFLDLVFEAQRVHRQHFAANTVQVSTLLSIKTGKCPEDCKYCSQSAHYDSQLEAEKTYCSG